MNGDNCYIHNPDGEETEHGFMCRGCEKMFWRRSSERNEFMTNVELDWDSAFDKFVVRIWTEVFFS